MSGSIPRFVSAASPVEGLVSVASPVEGRLTSFPVWERMDGLGGGDRVGLDIVVLQRYSREGENEKQSSASEVN